MLYDINIDTSFTSDTRKAYIRDKRSFYTYYELLTDLSQIYQN